MPRRVLFVCTGNTCRSPMAQMIAMNLARSRGQLDQFNFESAGTNPSSRYPDDRVECRALWAVERLGLDPSVIPEDRRCVRLDTVLARDWDVVVVMERGMKASVEKGRTVRTRVVTIRELAGKSGDISDPKGDSIVRYQEIAMELRNLLEGGWDALRA